MNSFKHRNDKNRPKQKYTNPYDKNNKKNQIDIRKRQSFG